MWRRDMRPETERALPFPARIARVVRRIVGAPDYDAYLEHCRIAGHEPRLSEEQYVAECFEARGKGVRCC
jgi:uncharacterized short protein YbdD (DUF466 family)